MKIDKYNKISYSNAYLPEDIDFQDDTIYIWGDGDYENILAMKCPCGCTDIIYLRLFGGQPMWQYWKNPDDTITISPSILRTVGCKSHFNIDHNMVKWA